VDAYYIYERLFSKSQNRERAVDDNVLHKKSGYYLRLDVLVT